MNKKFVSEANLLEAWQTHIQPIINEKQDQLPEGSVGLVLTKTEGGTEWKNLPGFVTQEELTQAKSDVKDELIGTAPKTYDTLGEIADYIEKHGEVAAAMAADIATKAPKSMFWTGTSSEYELITTKDPTTLYFIIEE